MTVACLYVDPHGTYSEVPDVDLWPESRDARLYAGPFPVVAHPPCARWSRLAGFTEARFGLMRGEDGGCFEAALASVRQWGGVLEHPAHSAAWARFDLPRPTWHAGWTRSLTDEGASCYVEQGRYGLPVKKATWLYAVGVELPELRWGYTPDGEGDGPNEKGRIHLDKWRDKWGGRREQWTKGQHHGVTATTPPAFRDQLIAMARTASRVAA